MNVISQNINGIDAKNTEIFCRDVKPHNINTLKWSVYFYKMLELTWFLKLVVQIVLRSVLGFIGVYLKPIARASRGPINIAKVTIYKSANFTKPPVPRF